MKKEDNMFAEVRKQMIVDVVNRETKITVSKLCEQFDVSPATIRNDLRELEEAGLLSEGPGEVIIENSCPSPQILELSWRLLGQPREREK